MVRHPGHRWISQDGKACLLASWFLSRDVAVHSGVVGASAPAPRCFKFRRKTRLGGLEARQLPTRRFGKTLAQPPGDSASWLRAHELLSRTSNASAQGRDAKHNSFTAQ